MSFNFKCPVCGGLLEKDDRTLRCENNHCFDLAKQGYVNLLQSQKSSKKRHGDDGIMVKARADFLGKGYYQCLCDGIIASVLQYKCEKMTVADLGCGECWYTSQMAKALPYADFCGIDISKHALISGAKRCPKLHLAVASTADLPICDMSCDVVVSVFAPCSENEIHRVLKDGGVWIKAFPLEKHLMGLKAVIYDKPYENVVDRTAPEGFELTELKEIRETITIDSAEDICNLFMMTPYYYKTGAADQEKLKSCGVLTTELEFGVGVYRKI